MSRVLSGDGVREILYGAAFLSTGAGGTLKTGLRMLSDLEREQEICLELIETEEMRAGTYAALAVGYGSPDAFLDTSFGTEALAAFTGLQREMEKNVKEISCLYSLEYAGFNTFTPMYVAMKKGIPLLDADCNAKAIPSLEKSLYTVRGGRTAPISMGGGKGDILIAYPAEPADFGVIEKTIRQMCTVYEQKLGVSTCVIEKAQISQLTIPGAISFAQKVGKAVRENIAKFEAEGPDRDGKEFFEKLRMITGEKSREICRGRLRRLDKDATDTYNKGTAVIEDENNGKLWFVDFKNESLLVRDGCGAVVTVPENICTYLADSGEPITNSELAEGMRLGICAVPAPGQWRKHGGFEMYRDMLAEAGYRGEPVYL